MANRFSVEAVFKAVDRMTAPVSRMQNRIGKMTRAMNRGLRRVNQTVGRLTSSITTGLKRGVIGATAVITGLGLAIKGVADQADALAKRSRRLEFPIEDLQEWQFVAEQSGFTMTEFDKSIEGMSKRLGEARAGTGSLFTFLNKTNKSLLRQLNATNNVSDAMDILIKAMQDSKDPMERAALANAAFGRQGLKMANIAELGTERIKQLRMEQRENGVITREQAEAAEAYNDAMNSLKRALFGFMQTVLIPMLPLLTDLIRQFREWTVANKEIIAGKILEFGRNLIDNFSEIVKWIKTIAIGIASFFALAAALKGIALVLGIINLLVAANPLVLLIMAAVAAVALLSGALDPVIEMIRDIMSGIGAAIGAIGSLFGFGEDEGDGDGAAASAQVTGPQERAARTIEERRTMSAAEVTIKDETGRADITKGKLGPGVSLQPSGGF